MTRYIWVLAFTLLSACATVPITTPEPMQQQDTATWAVQWWNPVVRIPNTMHLFIYNMMETCLGIQGRDFTDIQWVGADWILRLADLVPLSGVWGELRQILILANSHFNNPGTVSHELIHVIDPTAEHNGPEFQKCEIEPLMPTSP